MKSIPPHNLDGRQAPRRRIGYQTTAACFAGAIRVYRVRWLPFAYIVGVTDILPAREEPLI